ATPNRTPAPGGAAPAFGAEKRARRAKSRPARPGADPGAAGADPQPAHPVGDRRGGARITRSADPRQPGLHAPINMAQLLAIIFFIWLIVPLPAHADATLERQIIHILNRIALGPTEEAVAHVKAIGIGRYIDEQ